MSHIVRGKVDLAYTDAEILKKALGTIGNVLENARATVALGGGNYQHSGEKFDLVLQDRRNTQYRLGFRREANGGFVPYYDQFSSLGRWCDESLEQVKDRYIAYHYQSQLDKEGFKSEVRFLENGGVEVVAEEVTW